MKQGLHVFLALVLVLVLSSSAWSFTDTSSLNEDQMAAVNYLSGRGVINGYPDDTFRPFVTVTRAEFAKMICVYAGYGELNSGGNRFSDVASGAWYFGWVTQAANQSFVVGNTDGTFLPNNTISQQEIATILLRVQGIDETGMVWPTDYNTQAQTRGLDSGFSYSGATPASRIVAAQMIHNLVDNSSSGSGSGNNSNSREEELKGIVVELSRDDGSITIQDIGGKKHTLVAARTQVPSNLILGSYVEITYRGTSLVRFEDTIIPRRSYSYWDIIDSGKSVEIDGKSYDISNAEIFVVRYAQNRDYSDSSFRSAAAIDRSILSYGGTLEAEMAVVVDSTNNRIVTAYVVNSSVSANSGQLNVVDSYYRTAEGNFLSFIGHNNDLPLSSDVSGSYREGDFIYYTLKDGQIDRIDLIIDFHNDYVYSLNILSPQNREDPDAWVQWNGAISQTRPGGDIDGAKVEIISYNRGLIELGWGNTYESFSVADNCQIYEVDNNHKVSAGSTRNISRSEYALAIVNQMGEVCYLFCLAE